MWRLSKRPRPRHARRRRGVSRLVRRLDGVVGSTVLMASLFAGGSAGAVSGAASGYWSAAPPPPTVAANGLWVAADPAGPISVAALRLTLDAGEAPPVVVSLQFDQQTSAGVSIYACATRSPWQPTQGGSLAAAPKYDCTTSRVVGIPS